MVVLFNNPAQKLLKVLVPGYVIIIVLKIALIIIDEAEMCLYNIIKLSK